MAVIRTLYYLQLNFFMMRHTHLRYFLLMMLYLFLPLPFVSAQSTQEAVYTSERSEEQTTTAQAAPDQEEEYIKLTDEQRQYFMDKAMQKSRDLGRYLRLISNKHEVEEDKLYAIKEALNLFVSDSSRVEVSSVNRDIKQQFIIREYLQRLRLLPYDKVELVWIKAQMVSRFRKGEDGRYYGIITAQQLFRGFLENDIAYQDVTEKNIEVVLDRYLVFDEGIKKHRWDVFLSDISVQQTRMK